MPSSYNDNLLNDFKGSVRVASTTNVNISAPGADIDDVTLSLNDRVLLKDQNAGEENGIYDFKGAGFAMVRSRDANQAGELTAGAQTYIEEGTTNAGKTFIMTASGEVDLGVTSLTFAEAYSVPTGGGGVGAISLVENFFGSAYAGQPRLGRIKLTFANYPASVGYKIYYNNGVDFVEGSWGGPPGMTEQILLSTALVDQTISSIETYDETGGYPGTLIETYTGPNLPLYMAQLDSQMVIASGGGVTIDDISLGLNGVITINGSGFTSDPKLTVLLKTASQAGAGVVRIADPAGFWGSTYSEDMPGATVTYFSDTQIQVTGVSTFARIDAIDVEADFEVPLTGWGTWVDLTYQMPIYKLPVLINAVVAGTNPGEFVISGQALLNLNSVTAYYNGGSSVTINNPVGLHNELTVSDPALAGQTLDSVEVGYNNGSAFAGFTITPPIVLPS